MYYKLNQPDVIQETVDGETLIVHTRSGAYYNLEGCGTLIWKALLSGLSVAQVENLFDSNSEDERSAIRSGVDTLVSAFLAEKLILPSSESVHPSAEILGSAESIKPIFVNPDLRKFTDMEELLLVDPIHEVNPESGWPLQKDSERTA